LGAEGKTRPKKEQGPEGRASSPSNRHISRFHSNPILMSDNLAGNFIARSILDLAGPAGKMPEMAPTGLRRPEIICTTLRERRDSLGTFGRTF
jgi:hypothetical protein